MTIDDLKQSLFVAIILTLSFPPFFFGFLAPVGIAYFLNIIIQKNSRQAFRLGYLQGVFLSAFTLYWIGKNTIPGAIIVVLINGLHYAFVWWIFNLWYQKQKQGSLLFFPFLWVAIEFLRHFSDLRFNWLNIAYSQTYYLPFIQISEFTGYLGISFIILWISVLLFLIVTHREKRLSRTLILMVLIVLPTVFGYWKIHKIHQQNYPLIRAGFVQPNIDPFRKWEPAFQDSAFVVLENESRLLAPMHPDLVVWPETATPFFLRIEGKYLQRVFHLVDSLNVYLITGTPDFHYFPEKKEYQTYNAAFFFKPHSFGFQSYYKMALVPAAESMPFKKYLKFLRKINVGGGDFFPGTEFTVFHANVKRKLGRYDQGRYKIVSEDSSNTDSLGISTIICYESVFGHLVRKFVKSGANLLTIITNDGWFGTTSGPYQHAQYAVYRAIENRVSIVRCANTGISEFIDPTGKILEKAPLNIRKTLVSELPIQKKLTFYTRYGEWFGYLNLVVSLLYLIYFMMFKQKK